jgi:ferredoxin-thioredoxin reductase catalytic subunit
MDAGELYDTLRRYHEPLGYFFNRDRDTVFELLRSLILNKDRYGYMSCPCRLASGIYENDRDIICPCVYRPPDVKEFGSCYCGLYVSLEWNEGKVLHVYVPERRPKEKAIF